MKHLTPIKAIRAKCLDCCGGQRQEVKHCAAKECPIWPYRHGKRPKRETEGQRTQRQKRRASLILQVFQFPIRLCASHRRGRVDRQEVDPPGSLKRDGLSLSERMAIQEIQGAALKTDPVNPSRMNKTYSITSELLAKRPLEGPEGRFFVFSQTLWYQALTETIIFKK